MCSVVIKCHYYYVASAPGQRGILIDICYSWCNIMYRIGPCVYEHPVFSAKLIAAWMDYTYTGLLS